MSEENKNYQSQKSIPANKVQRASRFIKTGAKVGRNYVKHYAQKVVNPELSKDALHESNAADVYDALSELKGSALKIAQMMSMDKNMLPTQYANRFQMAQYSAPPLSYPLVKRTFQKTLNKEPQDLFDTFSKEAVNAASIGQVHKATKGGKTLAVKVQYPGVAESVKSDLKLVKPFAVNLLNLNEKEVNYYMQEVQDMLLSETDYENELQQSVEISEACAHLPHLHFPKYFPELSSKRILTMEWLDGLHIDKFLLTNPSQEIRNQIGQALWDFYDYQIHTLLAVHADPHPGNFLITADGEMGIIDFGCVKRLPSDFYHSYFSLLDPELLNYPDKMQKLFYTLQFVFEDDTEEDKKVLIETFTKLVELLGRPFRSSPFDFSKDGYFLELWEFGDSTKDLKAFRKSKRPRGARDGLYLNRTYYGIYNMLNQLGAVVDTSSITERRKQPEN